MHRPPSFESPGSIAFVLCELEWLRLRMLSRLADGRLRTFVDDIQEGSGQIDAGVIHEIRRAVDDVGELVDSIEHSFASLPDDVDVHADADAVARAAAAALENGIADPERALHAARWIGLLDGLRALMRMLHNTDAYKLWDLPIARFLAAFKGSDVTMARAVAAEASLTAARFTDLTTPDVRRLVAVLERNSGGTS